LLTNIELTISLLPKIHIYINLIKHGYNSSYGTYMYYIFRIRFEQFFN